MKFLILASLFVSTAALADYATLSSNGKSVEIVGGLKGTSSEAFSAIAKAYDEKFSNFKTGEEYFSKISNRNGSMGITAYSNPLLRSSVTSGVTVSYKLILNSKKKGSIKLLDKKTVEVTGETASILKGALAYDAREGGPIRVGMSVVESKSGKLTCRRAVTPTAPTICTIKL